MKRNILAIGGVVLGLLSAGLTATAADKAVKPLEIVSARWGVPGSEMDLTEKVKASVVEDCILEILAGNAYAGKDPAPGKSKSLTVKYLEFGKDKQVVVADHKTLQLFAAELTEELTVTKAFYGSNDKCRDVTAKIQKVVAAGGKLNVNNGTMGGDPAYGKGKKLYILYSVNNEAKLFSIPERGDFNAADMLKAPQADK
jgi:hypothetical protein